MRYSELQCSEAIHQAVERMGFDEMTEIQEKVIPLMMQGKDVIAKAPTGTGKTCAFGIPVAEHIAPDKTFLDLDIDAFRKVVDLNLFGTILPTTVFVPVMAQNKKGAIVNFCSESALRPLTRVVGYGAAKSAIASYTRYMATELATKFSPELRVNAIVPGFLLTNQNRALLTNPDGSYTDRAKAIIAHTPAGRFAEPEELFGTIHYLISDASSFVTGALSVVDGGFDVFSI